jgi:outer membrane protein TolC
MNLVLFTSGGLCWRNTQSDRSAGEIVELIRRFGFTGLVFVFLLTGITGPVAAQSQQPETVTVSQAVQEAVEKNLNLMAERYNLSIADARIVKARLRPNPVMSLYGDLLDLAGAGFNEQNAAGPPEYGIRADFIWERGDKRRYRIETAQQAKEVARMQLLNAVRALALDAQGAFIDVALAKENLKLAEDNLAAFNKIVRVNAERVRAGEIDRTRQEQSQIEARAHALEAEIRNEIAAAWRQYETARTMLARIEDGMLLKARRVLETMEFSYRSGEASLVEFLDAQRAFNDTTQSYNEARAEYARSLYLIDAAVGNGL